MKKTLFLGLILAASVQMFGASAQDLLKEARNDYYKNLNKKAEPVKVKREKVVKDAQKAMDEARKEMSDGTVESVKREEVEVSGYNDVLGRTNPKKVDINKKGAKKVVKKAVKTKKK